MKGKIKCKGDVIETVEDISYRIISVLGQGGMSVIYRAECQIGDDRTSVLLKAFEMPECLEYQDDIYEKYVRHELVVNKEINEKEFAGALTFNFSVHDKKDGNIYGVISAIRPGMTLQEYVRSPEFAYASLRDRIIIIKKLAQLVDNFHIKCRMIHGDISPDNIYILDTGTERLGEYDSAIALLDFGSARYMDKECEADIPIFAKEGYADPKLLSGERSFLNEDDDWYSVMCCLWYCFTGYSVVEYPVDENSIRDVYTQIAVKYEENNFSVTEGKEDISFIRNRISNYNTVFERICALFFEDTSFTSMLIKKLQILQDILDDTGIRRERLFANLQAEYEQLRNGRFSSLKILQNILPNVEFHLPQSTPRFIRAKNKQPETLRQIMNKSTESLFMIGDGGMGKTTSLIGIMDRIYGNSESVDDNDNPVIFIELAILSQDCREWYSESNGGTFIEQFIASYLTDTPRRFLDKNHSYVAPIREELFRTPEDGMIKYTVLLDGMNEIGFISEKSRSIFYETTNKYLKYAKNLRLIITGRNDIYELSSEHLLRLKALGLDDSNIKDVLLEAVKEGKISRWEYDRLIKRKSDITTNESRLWNCLKIPFFLMMYCMSSKRRNVDSQGEILRNFFHDKREILSGGYIYGEQSQTQFKHGNKKYDSKTELSMEYALKALLDFLMPEIAIRMVEKNYFFITEEKMYAVIEEYFAWMEELKRPQEWMRWYYGYMTDIRAIFREIRRIDNGNRIPLYACNVLGIMRSTANGTYFFTHQYFRDYFAACALINRMLTAIESREHRSSGWNASSKGFADMVYPLHNQEVSDYICALVGEILGERKNIPVYSQARKSWNISSDRTLEQNVIMDFLDFYRGIRGRVAESTKVQTGLKNVISILKKSRVQNDGNIDFSGIDFQNINVRQMSLKGIIFSHFGEDGSVYRANLQGTEGLLEALQKDDKQQSAVCCGIHPTKRKILILNESSNLLTELDLDSGERTVLFRITPGLTSAFYIGNHDNILTVTRSSEDDDSIVERVHKDNIGVSYFFRKSNQVLDCSINAEAYLGCFYSEEFSQISLFMKTYAGIVLLILDVEESHFEDNQKIVEVGRYIVPIEKKYWNFINIDTFMFTRLDKDNYLLSDKRLWKWNIGRWNIRSGELKSVFYFDDMDDKSGFCAVCRNENGRNTYFLEDEEDAYVIKSDEKHGVRDLDEFSKWSMSAGEKGKLLMLDDQNLLLVLSGGALSAYDMEKDKILWNCESLYILQIVMGHGILIANSDNGIYEIDIVDGGYKCLHLFHHDKIDFMIGRTSNMIDVILYESTGMVKWLNLENGCCFRQLSVQKANLMLDDIFYDENRGKLYGVSEDKVYRWNGWSGALEDQIILPYSNEWIILFSEFRVHEKLLEVYFERKEYREFPLQKRYFVREWSLEKKKWNRQYKETDDKKNWFRYVYPDQGEFYAMEYADKGEDIPGIPSHFNVEEKDMSFLDYLLEDEYEFEDDEWEEPKLRRHDHERMIWDTKYIFDDVLQKGIYYYAGKGKWRLFDNISGEKQILGITEKGVLYAINKGDSDADMELFRPGQEELIKFGGGYGQKFTAAFVVGNTFVGLASDNSPGMSGNKNKVFFWDTEKEELYEYEINETIYVTGCAVIAEDIRNKEEEKMMQMEGLLAPMPHKTRKIERFEKKSLFKPVNVKKLLKEWNSPVLFCVALLVLLNIPLQIGTIAEVYDRYFGVGSYTQNAVKYIVLSGVTILIYKIYYPRFICIMQQEKIYSKRMSIFLAAAMLGICLIKEVIIPYFEYDATFGDSTIIGTFLILPFVLAYFYGCPTGDKELVLGEIVFCGGWIWLLLTEERTYIITKMEIVLLIFFSIIYILGTCRIRIDGKKAFKKTLLYVGLASTVAIVSAHYIMLARGKSRDIAYILERHDSWSIYYQYVRRTVPQYKFWGKMNPIGGWKNQDFVYHFSLNYVMECYGWVCGAVIVIVVILLLFFMWKGARQQTVLIDRCICMSCTIYYLIETVIAFLPAIGIGLIPPYRLPFWGGTPYAQRTTWLVFGIYMSFYHAHRRCRR